MFGFSKKKNLKEDSHLYAPLSGEIISISEVADPVFSKKMMGDGYAVEPTGNQLFAPVSAKVSLVQGHALGFVRADGLEVLLHVGIDTVSLNGAPFTFKVKEGDIVDGGQEIGHVDWDQVKKAGLSQTTMIVFTNTQDKLANFEVKKGTTTAGADIGSAQVK